jgi:hypothetical protein
MATLSATYLDDLGRVRLELLGATMNVRYRVQRSTDTDPTWVDVRGAQNMSTISSTIIDDYEYTPNVTNHYRLVAPGFYDSFLRTTPNPGTTWGTADTGHVWNLGGSSPGFNAYVDNGIGVVESTAPPGNVVSLLTDPIVGATDAEIVWSGIMPDASLDNTVEFNIGLRAANFTDFYESQMLFLDSAGSNANHILIRIAKTVAGVFTALTAAVTVGEWQQNRAWHARFRVESSNLQMRAWEEGTEEPSTWTIATSDTDIVAGTAVHARARKAGGAAYSQWFGPMELQTIPQTIDDTVSVTPVQTEVFLKSITYPLFNRPIDCVDWQELSRASRTGFFDVKGRHHILGIADVGSSATFDLTFISRSQAENRGIVALLTYGGVMLLQPPGDNEDEECPTAYSGTPDGYVMVNGTYTQSRTVYGKPQWLWTVTFTRVAPNDADSIIPTTITWAQLWELIGPEGTWLDVWATWPTWQALWLTPGNPLTFGELG